jgi:hypothetical protein
MSRFAGLAHDLSPNHKKKDAQPQEAQAEDAHETVTRRRSPTREGKKGILGYFSPELSKTLNMLALEEDTSLQALMGEAFDLLLRARGKHPFGER